MSDTTIKELIREKGRLEDDLAAVTETLNLFLLEETRLNLTPSQADQVMQAVSRVARQEHDSIAQTVLTTLQAADRPCSVKVVDSVVRLLHDDVRTNYPAEVLSRFHRQGKASRVADKVYTTDVSDSISPQPVESKDTTP
jgi:hypothetical protein